MNQDSELYRVDFDRRLELKYHGSKVTSDADVLTYRELDDDLGSTEMFVTCPDLRTSIYVRPIGIDRKAQEKRI